MGGTKIFVLKLKDVLKIAAFGVIGLVVLGVLAFFFVPRGGGSIAPAQPTGSLYIPGTYTASIILNDRPLDVMVTVTEDEIVSVEMTEMYENQRLLFPLFEPMMERVSDDILFYQRGDIAIHNEFPVTTGILQQAVVAALDRASVYCCHNSQ